MSNKVVFISNSRRLTLYPVVNDKAVQAKFSPGALIGTLMLDAEKDKDLIEALKNHPLYGKEFSTKDSYRKLKQASYKVIQGMSAGVNFEEAKQEVKEEMKEEIESNLLGKFQRFNELKPIVVKLNGDRRVDATDEDYAEFEQLKSELKL